MTSARRPSPARRASPCPSGPAQADATPGQPGSAWLAAPVSWPGNAPAPGKVTRSPSAREARLAAARQAQASPAWQADYKATRPKVERKIGHLMRRRHGGRRARVRGRVKVAADFVLLAAATNIARLATLGVTSNGQSWAMAST